MMKIKGRNDLFLVKGQNEGSDAWYYILVDKLKLALYEKDVDGDFIKLGKYGQILYSGWGEEPPEEIKDKIKEEYG